MTRTSFWTSLVLLAVGCSSAEAPVPAAPPADEPAAVTTPREKHPAAVREGGALVRSADDDALFVADEDHSVVRRIPLPVDVATPGTEIAMPGRPAQVLSLSDRLLVTIREPGFLLELDRDGKETARVALPQDAWGIAVTPDETTALVSSAWTHQISAVDVETGVVRWTVDVAREPRGIVIAPDGASAYVTHLVGTSITKLDGIGTDAPRVTPVALPAAPLRAQWQSGDVVGASLGYAAAMNGEGTRLYVARHALGALGPSAWYGAGTVDVLLPHGDKPLAPRRTSPAFQSAATFGGFGDGTLADPAGTIPTTGVAPFVQPRAMVYRKSTRTLLVAGEGDDVLAELEADAVAPAIQPLRVYHVGQEYGDRVHLASACGAPAGVALSADDSIAYVFCRSTYDLAIVTLDRHDEEAPFQPGPIPFVRLAEDPGSDEVSMGRRLFFDATDETTSGGLGCAGCHPEGRDDGYVWHEMPKSEFEKDHLLLGTPFVLDASGEQVKHGGQARQTPMLAGRVSPIGPYGWLAESPTLERRVRAGLRLHRWFQAWRTDMGFPERNMREGTIAAYLREGLVPPPAHVAELTPQEERGKELFMSEATQCSSCHAPKTGYTDRSLSPLRKLPARRGYDEDETAAFRVPSLLFVGGTAPYYHDGHAATLEQLVDLNGDRMGKTGHLSAADRAALVAFLRTL